MRAYHAAHDTPQVRQTSGRSDDARQAYGMMNVNSSNRVWIKIALAARPKSSLPIGQFMFGQSGGKDTASQRPPGERSPAHIHSITISTTVAVSTAAVTALSPPSRHRAADLSGHGLAHAHPRAWPSRPAPQPVRSALATNPRPRRSILLLHLHARCAA